MQVQGNEKVYTHLWQVLTPHSKALTLPAPARGVASSCPAAREHSMRFRDSEGVLLRRSTVHLTAGARCRLHTRSPPSLAARAGTPPLHARNFTYALIKQTWLKSGNSSHAPAAGIPVLRSAAGVCAHDEDGRHQGVVQGQRHQLHTHCAELCGQICNISRAEQVPPRACPRCTRSTATRHCHIRVSEVEPLNGCSKSRQRAESSRTARRTVAGTGR